MAIGGKRMKKQSKNDRNYSSDDNSVFGSVDFGLCGRQ